ncbi:hypothetical protein AURDEDRAFT_124643 [Auricularia subglabra TFB-10046 SS5]|nr:hypothetical protein AURDEDRAFT_124643 [Auricularia subglabra TFB-10046 SS5]
MLLIPSILALAGAAGAAQTWYALQWNAPSFTSISGQLTVPKRPGGAGAVGTPYVWPGVQNSNGVLQAVLDGCVFLLGAERRSLTAGRKNNGNWWIGNGWYGNPSLPWGAGFSVSPGQVVNFSLKSNGNGTWTGTLSGAGSAQTTFALPGQTMTTAVLAVEVYNNPFDFSPVHFTNVVMTATTAASGWCKNIGHLGYPVGVEGKDWSVTFGTISGNTCNIPYVELTNVVT